MSVMRNTIDASFFCRGAEALQSEAQDRIEIGEDDKSGVGAFAVQVGGKSQYIGELCAVCDGALAGALDHRAICHGIAERHAQFEHVGARINGGERDLARGRQIRIASRQVYDQTRLAAETNRHGSIENSVRRP